MYRVPAHFPIFGLRVYSYARLFHSGGGRLFDGGKKSDRSFVSDFLKLLDGSRWKIGLQNFPDRFLLSNAWKESSTNRLVFLLIDTFWNTDKTRGKGEIRRRRYFFSRPLVVEEKSWRKENESRGTKEREERTNSSQTIKTNDPVAPLVHPPRLTAEWRLIRPNENTGGIERPSPTIAHRPTSSLNQPFLLIPFVSPNRLPRPSENRSLN